MSIESGDLPGSQDSFYLSDVSPSDKPWDKHRNSASRVQELYGKVDLTRYSQRVAECSKRLDFAFRANDLGEVRLRLYAAKFCRLRHCPVCQWRRSLMWRARFFKAIPGILKDYPATRFLFLTLTVRNCDLGELRSTLSHMNNAWKLLTKRKQFPALGWVKTVEVTRSKDGTVHPHFHAILMVKEGYFKRGYLSQAKWTELWQNSLKVDYTPIVNVKVVKPSKNLSESESGLDSAMVSALCETLKYSVKESDLTFDAEFLKQLTTQLHKTRAIALGGIFKEYLSEDEPEDLIHTDLDEQEPSEDEDIHVWFGWREMVRRYVKE